MGSEISDYAKCIVDKLLKLQKGDSLSINCEEDDFAVAKVVADTALEVTDVQVKIVLTNKGKPVDVIEFDPELTTTKPCGAALLRIAHVENEAEHGKVLEIKADKDDFVALQKLGHLAEPVVLNRRIAIPYCVVPSLWDGFDFDVDKKFDQIDYRKKFLNSTDIDTLCFNDENNDFTLDIPEENLFSGCQIRLSNGRDFINSSDYEVINALVDMNSLNGKVRGEATVLGRKQAVELEYRNGKITDFSSSKELKELLGFDEMLKKPGFLSFKDNCFKLFLGGSLLQCLKKEPESEDEIPVFFNTSLYSLEVRLPDKINISYKGCDGQEKELVRRGFFII